MSKEKTISSLWKSFMDKVHKFELKNWLTVHKWQLAAGVILIVGCLVRVVGITKYPVGFNQDEASVAYEAYAVTNYGIDRNGNSLPLHYVAWGSGQNAMYGWMITPFVKILGPTTLAARLPIALVGCITLIVAYFLFKKILGDKKALVLLFIFAITPWHIMKSRWALDCNVFPDLIFWAIAALYYGVTSVKRIYFIISSIIIGLSSYAYGTSYVFIPVLYVAMYGYLVWKKKVSWKEAILYVSLAAVIALPMMIFVVINYFGLNTIHLGPITIPKLDYNRFATITSMNGNFFSNCYHNLIGALGVTLKQSDEVVLNAVEYFGLFYGFSLPFIIAGIVYSIRDKEVFCKLINAFMIAALAVAAFVEPNINRINALWIPMIFYLGYGILRLCRTRRNICIVCGCYSIGFLFFVWTYFGSYQKVLRDENVTFYGLEEAIDFTSKLDSQEIYISEKINQPYIYYLWYSAYDPNLYLQQRNITEKEVMFQEITSIGDVHFNLPEKLKKGSVYIIEKSRIFELAESKKNHLEQTNEGGVIKIKDFEVAEFGNYYVLY